jgi:ribose/xylose/arabinose/galactoside ABC-type transport system permease subunit
MKYLAAVVLAASLALAGSVDASTFVAAVDSGTTDLGDFAAGNYNISATGLASLVNVPGQFDIRPDGIPDTPVTFPGYGYFNPAGTDIADGFYGPGGVGIKIGALMGSFVAVAPLGNFHAPLATYFFIGNSLNLTHTGGHIYAQVNDTFYSNDLGGFDVTVTRLADSAPGVPEPGTWALMLTGFLGAGTALRRRRTLQLR